MASTLAVMTVGGRMVGLLLAVDGGMGKRGIIHNPTQCTFTCYHRE